MADLEAANAQLTDELAIVKGERDGLRQKVKQQADLIEALQKEIAEREGDKQRMLAQIRELQAETERLNGQVAGLSAELEETKRLLQEQTDRVSGVQASGGFPVRSSHRHKPRHALR